MGLFDSLRKVLGTGAGLRDPFEADPETRQIVRDMRRGDLTTMAAFLAGLHHGAWADRQFIYDSAAQHARTRLLDAWCEAEPTSQTPFLLRGARRLYRAQENLRSAQDRTPHAENVLIEAQADLLRAAELEPADPTPHAYMTAVSGLRGLKDNARGYFEEATRRDRSHFGAHIALLEALSQRWGGDHDEMFDFARDLVTRHPVGSDLGLILLAAHVERWFFSHGIENDARTAKAWLQNPAVTSEALSAYKNSIGSPQYQPDRFVYHRRNLACFWFYLVEDIERLRVELSLLDGVVARIPWCYLGEDVAATLGAAKKRARKG